MSDDRWELHDQLADALGADPSRAAALGDELGLPADEVENVVAALAALGAVTALDEPDPAGGALDAGETIGDYRILERVGRGGFGVVYRARDPVLEVDVALKLIAVAPGLEHEVQDRFAQEARAVARLDHPHVVRVRSAGWDPRGPYLVMDFVSGESLQRKLEREGPLSPRAAVELVRQLAEALEHAHEQGVLHRDVKPDNVLVNAEGVAQLTDFGLARDALAGGESAVSQAGHALGTPGYWPPEQARGDLEAIGPRSDVYGLGATLYALLTGRTPYTGPHTLAILEAMARRAEVPAPSSLQPAVSAALDEICARCLELDPAARYATAGELAQALSAADVLALAPTLSRRSWGTRAACLAGLAAAVALGVAATRGDGGASTQAAGGVGSPASGPASPAGLSSSSSPVASASSGSSGPVAGGTPDTTDPPAGSVGPPPAEADRLAWWDRSPAWGEVETRRGPTANEGATFVSDGAGQRVLVFGGSHRKALSQALWSWNGAFWALQPSVGPQPPARSGAGGAFDLRRKRLVVFGGRGADGLLGDLWEWNGTTWSTAALPAGAQLSKRTSATYDARRGVCVVLLGREVWEWNGATWARKPAPPVSGQQLVWSAARQRVLLFGQDGRLWDYDGTAWKGATSPLPRTKQRFMWAVAAGADGVLALVGPKPDRKRGPQLETWLYTQAGWQRLAAGNPGMPLMAGMAWVPGQEQAVLVGADRKRRAPTRTITLSPGG